MTATPIPRTLALTVYGDLDVSVLDEMPPGREAVTTAVRDEASRTRVHDFLRSEVSEGRQVFIVYPLVEESDKVELAAATKMYEELREGTFRDANVGLVHGRMKPEDKDAVMDGFKRGETDILVSTTVVEVGVDVPNASVMVIEHAERFGLAQLHQLRGRVGRGAAKSYCILMVGPGASEEARERIQVLADTNDGFVIAERDLEMRGPGEFLGVRQHGLPRFSVADLAQDSRLLVLARDDAFAFVEGDPEMSTPEGRLVRDAVGRRFKGRGTFMDIG
jgi:ATP-dependent DNA helicase RecG